jgi:integrase/recombinase XerD
VSVLTHKRFHQSERPWLMSDYFVTRRQWKDWMRSRGMSEATITQYGRAVGVLFDELEMEPKDVREEHVLAYLAARGGQGPAKSMDIRAFRSYFGFMSARGIISIDPSADLKAKKKKYAAPDYLNESELGRVMNAARDRSERRFWALQLCYATGVRVGSLCKLKPSDIDVGREVVHVRNAKGGGDYDVPMGDRAVQAATWLLGAYEPRKGPYLLGIVEGTFWMWCREAGVDAEIPRRVHPHLLRHSFATHLVQRGVDIDIVRRLLNHQSLAVTQVYVGDRPEEKQRAVNLV